MQVDMKPETGSGLFEGLFDYAGLFPPAGLPMNLAVRNYCDYQRGPNRRMLNTLVVPANRLQEFSGAANSHQGCNWRLSVLSSDWEQDETLVADFRGTGVGGEIISIETRVVEDVPTIRQAFKNVYVELPLGSSLRTSIPRLKSLGANAKIRMGGLTEDAFPSCIAAAEFFVTCAEHAVAFKATAGLHHPFRSRHMTCDKPGALSVDMHGFINVLQAVHSALGGNAVSEVAKELECSEENALSADTLADHSKLTQARSLFHSIGSCSFEEPIDELEKLGWL